MSSGSRTTATFARQIARSGANPDFLETRLTDSERAADRTPTTDRATHSE